MMNDQLGLAGIEMDMKVAIHGYEIKGRGKMSCLFYLLGFGV